jgi:hypothetical protein
MATADDFGSSLVTSGDDWGSSFGSASFFSGLGFVEKDSFDCCLAASPLAFPKNLLHAVSQQCYATSKVHSIGVTAP